MILLRHILADTPFWVFALLAYLLWQGMRALQPKVVSVRRLLLVPALFLLSGTVSLLARRLGLDAWLAWGGALLLLLPAGLRTGPSVLAVDPDAGLVLRAGSAMPLVRNVSVFVLQYALAVAAAMHPDPHSVAVLAGRAASGATSGYFLGWLLALRGHYRAAPRQPLRAT